MIGFLIIGLFNWGNNYRILFQSIARIIILKGLKEEDSNAHTQDKTTQMKSLALDQIFGPFDNWNDKSNFWFSFYLILSPLPDR